MAKMYVLVRSDLSKSQQAVQGGHAVAEYLLKYKPLKWDNGTMVYLSIHPDDFMGWRDELSRLEVIQPYSVFSEPDLDYQATAIAVICETDALFDREVLL